jgi:hypothetical protein
MDQSEINYLSRMLKLFILSLLVSFQTSHVSFLGMECIPDKGLIKTHLKMTYNDFMFDYRMTINDDQYFDPAGKIDTTVILVNQYLHDKIRIYADNRNLKSNLISFESDNGEMRFELLFYYDKKPKQFRVINTILDGINIRQKNLLIFKYDEVEEGVSLSYGETQHTFIVK